MELPKISIVIPSYNKAEFIKSTLDSIFEQKYPKLEVIIQDGGSTDGTLEIIKKYAARYPKTVTWKSEKDNGQVDAINKGIKRATGDVLTYINADDVYYGKALQKVGEFYAKNPDVLWIAGRGRVIDSKGREISREVTLYKNFLLKLNWYPLLLSVNYLTQPSVFFTKAAYGKFGPFTGTNEYVLEYAFWLKLGKVKMPEIINKALSSFRISGQNISSVFYKNLLNDDYKLVRKYTKNPLILIMHKLHNLGRVLVINNIKG